MIFDNFLPAVRGGTISNIIHSCIKSYNSWQKFVTRHLSINIRLQLYGNEEAGHFDNLLLKIGGGSQHLVQGPDIITIFGFGPQVSTAKEQLIGVIFFDFVAKHTDDEWLSERDILAPLNKTVALMNLKLIYTMPGECITYTSLRCNSYQ